MSEVEEHGVDEQEAALPKAAAADAQSVEVQATALGELDAADPADPEQAMGLSTLMDMPVKVTVEVGRVGVSLGELCRLGPGSTLCLDREAHEPADILVNGKVVARGEIVTVDGSYGVRISEVVR